MKDEPNRTAIHGERTGSSGALRFDQVVRPLLVALGVVVLVFCVYEIVERTWLISQTRHIRRDARLARDGLSILVLAVGIAWMILKASPRLIMESSAGEDGLTRKRLTEEEQIRRYAWWFICMRWIAVMLAAILVCTSVWVFRWLPRSVFWPLLMAVVILALVNLFYMVWLQRNRRLPFLLPVQAFVDLGILTFLLHFSGGIENPLCMFVVFHVIIGGILLSCRQCYALAATASGLFMVMALGEWSGIIAHHSFRLSPEIANGGQLVHLAQFPLYVFGSAALQTAVLFLTAFFVTTLAQRARNDEKRLEILAERAMAGQQLLEQALETTGTGLRVLNPNLQTRWANNRWQEWFGPTAGCDSSAARLLNGENSPARQCFQDGEVRVTELVMGPHAGEPPPTLMEETDQSISQVTTAPLKGVAGQIQQVVELAENITPHKQAQARMVRAGKLAAVGQLAGQVAHEVNNPIAIISGKARLLLSDHRQDMTPKIAQEMRKIAEMAERVGRIAQGLLSYSRPSSGNRNRLDVRLPIRKSLAMIEEPARRGRVVIEDSLPDHLLPVHASAPELEQVFLDLFLNALDAMPQGGCLRLSAQTPNDPSDQGSSVAIIVDDTGSGISPEIREKIFEPFFTTKQEGRGTGLGLGICLGLIRSHQGDIEVESEPGKGTRFIVKLPADSARAREEEPVHA